MYWPGVSCQFAGLAGLDCLLVVVSVRASWDKCSSQSPCGMEFTTIVVVPLLEFFCCIVLFCCLHRATVAGIVSPCRCNHCTQIDCNKELVCSMLSSDVFQKTSSWSLGWNTGRFGFLWAGVPHHPNCSSVKSSMWAQVQFIFMAGLAHCKARVNIDPSYYPQTFWALFHTQTIATW